MPENLSFMKFLSILCYLKFYCVFLFKKCFSYDISVYVNFTANEKQFRIVFV